MKCYFNNKYIAYQFFSDKKKPLICVSNMADLCTKVWSAFKTAILFVLKLFEEGLIHTRNLLSKLSKRDIKSKGWIANNLKSLVKNNRSTIIKTVTVTVAIVAGIYYFRSSVKINNELCLDAIRNAFADDSITSFDSVISTTKSLVDAKTVDKFVLENDTAKHVINAIGDAFNDASAFEAVTSNVKKLLDAGIISKFSLKYDVAKHAINSICDTFNDASAFEAVISKVKRLRDIGIISELSLEVYIPECAINAISDAFDDASALEIVTSNVTRLLDAGIISKFSHKDDIAKSAINTIGNAFNDASTLESVISNVKRLLDAGIISKFSLENGLIKHTINAIGNAFTDDSITNLESGISKIKKLLDAGIISEFRLKNKVAKHAINAIMNTSKLGIVVTKIKDLLKAGFISYSSFVFDIVPLLATRKMNNYLYYMDLVTFPAFLISLPSLFSYVRRGGT